MLRVGELARMAGVSVRTLHHYDEVGLLKPRFAGANGYRYYAPSQLADLRHILAMKALGLSLSDVRLVLDGAPFVDALQRRRVELLRLRDDADAQLARLDEALAQEMRMSQYSVELREVPAARVLSATGIASDFRHVAQPMGKLFCSVMEAIPKLGVQYVGPCVAIWRGGGYQSEQQIELETVAGISGEPSSPQHNEVRATDLPAIRAACTRHVGSYERFGDPYGALLAWMSREGYVPDGPVREVYLHHDNDPEKCVSELHIPVKKA